MVLFYNPFTRKEQSNFPGVVVPLANAPERAPSPLQSDTENKPNPDEKPNETPDEKSLDRSDRSENGVGPVPGGPLTIEGLKAEVEEDVAASGHDSAYDRMFFCDCQWATFFSTPPGSSPTTPDDGH